MEGIKVSKEYVNPIDLVIAQNIMEPVNPYLHELNFTPNMLTTFSLIFEVMFIYYYCCKRYTLAALCFWLGYLFDCFDGNYARTYKMETDFGDKYDHFTDLFTVISYVYLVLTNSDIRKESKVMFCVVNIFLAILCHQHMSCQDSYCNNNNTCETSSFFSHKKCLDHNKMRYTKFFGSGTLALFNTMVILFTNYL